MASFYISAAHKSSGKTTLSIGLGAAIRQRGLEIQAFKKGPDYIDPIWLGQATGSPCHNLDFFTSSHEFILQQFFHFSQAKDVALVEGNMGLYDGLSLDGSDSNAAMAKLLGIPVILVVDCSGTSRGIAPILMGHQQFDTEVEFAGVILNKVAGSRHETKMREVVEAYTDFQILGAVPRSSDVQLTERHLGLIPSHEVGEQSGAVIALLAEQARQHVDIDCILTLGGASPCASVEPKPVPDISTRDEKVRVGVAMDEAFGFYYPGDLQRFHDLGVEIVPFSTLDDPSLPEPVDALFIGGGFPETQIDRLSANRSMMESIRHAIESGLPAYAECGGLMYLCQDIEVGGASFPLCQVIPASVSMSKRPQGRGYVILEALESHPWYRPETESTSLIRAHEFHYSALHGLPEMTYAYSMKRGTGIDGQKDGIILHNLLASYTHLRSTDLCSWVDDFINFVHRYKSS